MNDKEGLSKAIVGLMDDGKKRSMMRRNNIAVREKYNVEKIGDLWMNNIKRLVKQ